MDEQTLNLEFPSKRISSTKVLKKFLVKLSVSREVFSEHFKTNLHKASHSPEMLYNLMLAAETELFTTEELDEMAATQVDETKERIYKEESVDDLEALTNKLWPLANNFFKTPEIVVYKLLINDKARYLHHELIDYYNQEYFDNDPLVYAFLQTCITIAKEQESSIMPT